MMNRFRRMMYGRYGNDQLGNALLTVCLVFIVLQWFFRLQILNILTLAFFFWFYFRVFSRNIQARYAENQKFLTFWRPVSRKLQNQKVRFQDRKFHKYYTCKNCKTTLRVPRGRGKISITCPNCKQSFIKKT